MIHLSINLTVRPVEVEIVRQERQLSAGKEVELVCAARGSRPAARITWWRGDTQIPNVEHTVSYHLRLEIYEYTN